MKITNIINRMHIEDEIKLIESNMTTFDDKIHKNIEGFCIDDKKIQYTFIVL